MSEYDSDFYKHHQEMSASSAGEIVPLVLELVRPKRVVDVGCGLGTWLSVFRKNGIEDILGIDGEWVDPKMLLIPEDKFRRANLKEPLKLDRTFDLVVSLEVAEHLPEEHAETFVSSLTGLGPVILFSAAIPFQGGQNHVNEQWPEYWQKLFKRQNFVIVDCLRKLIWNNEKVEYWYAQNIFIYVKKSYLKSNKKLHEEWKTTDTSRLSVVHPQMYLRTANNYIELKNSIPRPVIKIGKKMKRIMK
ncbi:MAG: class I SAM-dependent methyltransferase [Thermoplasmata archaeon]|nr:MAG: class I SAM-dependent methyltransferase [Thermoplasmata archaeon]